jgi:hypothetical protein
MRRIAPLLVLAAVIAGCGSNASDSDPTAAAQPAPAPAPAQAAPATAPMGENLSGKVLESIPAPPYVYLRLQTAQGEIWAAVSDAPVEVGAEVTVYQSMRMSQFASKSLQRTFDEIYFGSLTAPGAPVSAGNPHAGLAQPTATAVDKVEKASGADARSVEETWSQGAALAGKTVVVRGKVVKYNPGVMGKNWIHIQDGSGDAAKGTNDLTVTSMDEAAIGDIVTVTGTVSVDKDFGAGYRYPIIVEEAKVAKQ